MKPPAISRLTLWFFRGVARSYVRRDFHALRLSAGERLHDDAGPMIVYGNHSSWWDPISSVLLARSLLPRRRHYAPMEAAQLKRYAILRRIGVFPIDPASTRGAAHFLRVGEAVLAAGGVLWVTPQGRFADARSRPLGFRPGLATLALRVAQQHGHCTLIPVAGEYTFWDERMPEALLRIGEPLRLERTYCEARPHALDIDLERRLTEAMEELKALSVRRDPLAFRTLVRGSAGIGGLYALVQRIDALLHGREYHPEHTQTPAAAASFSREETVPVASPDGAGAAE